MSLSEKKNQQVLNRRFLFPIFLKDEIRCCIGLPVVYFDDKIRSRAHSRLGHSIISKNIQITGNGWAKKSVLKLPVLKNTLKVWIRRLNGGF
jgi:hypothetical protein